MATYENGHMIGAMALGRVEMHREITDPLAAAGAAMAMRDPLVAAARSAGPSEEWRRGFDIGTAKSAGNSQPGPGQEAVLALMTTVPLRSGFLVARAQQYAMTLANARGLTKGNAGVQVANPADDGPSTPVLVGAGIAAVAVLGGLYYFLTK